MLSIIHTLEIWRHYLKGSHHQFEIWNDHANLKYFMQSQDLNWHQACWWQWLTRFNYIVVYKPGATNVKADTLSRRKDYALGIEDDNKGIVMIPLEQIWTLLVEIHDEGEQILSKIQKLVPALKESKLRNCVLSMGYAMLIKFYTPRKEKSLSLTMGQFAYLFWKHTMTSQSLVILVMKRP